MSGLTSLTAYIQASASQCIGDWCALACSDILKVKCTSLRQLSGAENRPFAFCSFCSCLEVKSDKASAGWLLYFPTRWRKETFAALKSPNRFQINTPAELLPFWFPLSLFLTCRVCLWVRCEEGRKKRASTRRQRCCTMC